MFTGIVEAVGTILQKDTHHIVVDAPLGLAGTESGDSIAVNGTCLTIVNIIGSSFTLDLSEETLARTALGSLESGSLVNLERALTPLSRMGGHFVQGHIDGVGTITEIVREEKQKTLIVETSPSVAHYLVEKGFVALDGISLTLTKVVASTFSVAVIPYTWEHTILHSKQTSDLVNLEVDIIAKYVERLVPTR